MLVETTSLPIHIQEQIIAHQQSDMMTVAKNKTLLNSPITHDNLMATAGLWAKYHIDGVDYQNQLRSEWKREWEKDNTEMSQ